MNDLQLTFLNFFYRITRPNHWIKVDSYSRDQDYSILEFIEKDNFLHFSESNLINNKVYLAYSKDGKIFWIQNYPYAYGKTPFTSVHCGSYVAVKLKNYLKTKHNSVV